MQTQTMQTIRFETSVEGNVIRIPERYIDASRKAEKVVVVLENVASEPKKPRTLNKNRREYLDTLNKLFGHINDEDLPHPEKFYPGYHPEKKFTKFAGALSDEDYQEITEALKDTERVDIDEWECRGGHERPQQNDESNPKRGTLEYLFRDYDGTSFQTELVDLGAPVGNEKW